MSHFTTFLLGILLGLMAKGVKNFVTDKRIHIEFYQSEPGSFSRWMMPNYQTESSTSHSDLLTTFATSISRWLAKR